MCLLSFVCIVRGFFDGFDCFLQNFLEGVGWGMDGWFFLVFNDYLSILLGLVTCLRWSSILFIERYLAAKFGTIF